MTDIAIRFDDVSKRFRKGERFDSLRDLLPHMLGRVMGRETPQRLPLIASSGRCATSACR